ncbi:hypothetical protein E1A91_A11G253400v1 [Gossypium mustelinum]|uniref:Uncharacterized protein n=1 Tax=Gossypium mustelinum TaxID=34275 RepID=A0A5D2XBF6_GOSMU|nr:hypothetical protein E1A91_A11G253400v1 [Gossypium mustelinum]
MAANQTAALKVGLCLLGLCLFGYIVGPPLYWHFMEGLVAFSYTSNTCPPCLCDFSSQPLLTIPEEVCEKKISFSLTFYLDLNKLIKRLWSVCKMKVLTPHKLKKSKTKPMKHLKRKCRMWIVKCMYEDYDSDVCNFVVFSTQIWGYVGIHSSGFKDFLLKLELLRSIVDSGFKHPSEGCGFWGNWSCSMFPLQRLHKSFHEVH